MQTTKTNFNALKLIIVLATAFIVWNNVENFTLNTGGIIHNFSNYLSSAMIYVVLMAFGYLSCNNQLKWKDYKKLLLALAILSFLSSFMYFDYFAFKEGYATVAYLVGVYFKVLFFDYGKWLLWIIVGLSALFKYLREQFPEQSFGWKVIRVNIMVITIILFFTVMIVGLYSFIIVNVQWSNDFDRDLIYISLREGSFLQLIPGIMTFLIGINLNWLVQKIKKNSDVWALVSWFGFIAILSLRIIFHLPTIYWDFMIVIQAMLLLIPFLVWKVPNWKFIDLLFYGTIVILMFHIAFNKLISFEFVLGLLIRAIFGLNAARRVEEFVNNNMAIALLYSLTKVMILLMFCAWISKQYAKLFKFDFVQPSKASLNKNLDGKKTKLTLESNIKINTGEIKK